MAVAIIVANYFFLLVNVFHKGPVCNDFNKYGEQKLEQIIAVASIPAVLYVLYVALRSTRYVRW